MEDNSFSLKCDAHAVKVKYDSNDNISIIKVFPEPKSDINIVFGKHSVNISDDKLRQKRSKREA